MAERNVGDKKQTNEHEKNEPSVQAEDHSVAIGGISIGGDLKGNLQVAAGDIVTNVEATAARTEKEFEVNELEELKLAILEKIDSLRADHAAPLATDTPYHLNALALNEGKYLLGRADVLHQLTRRIDLKQAVFLSGRGGVGRTSLLQAGLMPVLLEDDHLPVLVSLSREPLELSIKRSILTRVESTTYLKRLNLAKFLEHAAKSLPENKRLLLLLDGFENIYEQTPAEQLQAFEAEWRLTQSNRRLRWVFSIDRGFSARLATFQPDDILELPPLDRAAATQVLVDPEQGGLKLEEAYLNEILNELESHRDSIKGASINPSELQVVIRSLAESDPSRTLSEIYEKRERVNGIFEEYLARTIANNFIPAQRPIVWQILTFLNEEYGRPVSMSWIEAQLRAYGFEVKNLPDLLRSLRKNHVIRVNDENYELAHVNLKRGIQKWLNEQTLLKNARAEYIDQLNNIRASALRGMFGGALGFALFRWIVGGSPQDLTAIAVVFFTLLYAVIGGLSGLLLTFLSDVFIARHGGARPWQRYLLSAATGLITFGLG
ncbi:MAG TPA: hypothetical protein VJM08_18480, partial [Anaerolineales bacterium]|nr:hypothetical protein [Anaerolineales bacterium]